MSKGIKIYHEAVLHPHVASILGVLWLGTERCLSQGSGSEVSLASLSRVIYQAKVSDYFSKDLNFYQDQSTLLSWLRVVLKVLADDHIIFLMEPGDRVGFLEEKYLTLPTGILSYLNLTGVLSLWEGEFKTHTEERE